MSATTQFAIMAAVLLGPIALFAYHGISREHRGAPDTGMIVGALVAVMALGGGLLLLAKSMT